MSHDCHKAIGVGCHMNVTKLLGLDVTWLTLREVGILFMLIFRNFREVRSRDHFIYDK